MILYNLVKKRRPARTLEIGMAYAASTLFICEALRENGGGRHIAMDPFQDSSYKNIGVLNLKRAGFDSVVTFYNEESHRVLPRLLEQGSRFDFAFIDGDHLFDSVLLDFYYVDKMLEQGGLVMFHDMDMPSVRKAVSFVLRNKPYTLLLDCYGEVPTLKRQWLEFLKNVRACPLEPLTWKCHSFRAPFLTALLQKTGEDYRLWTHYAPF